MRVSFRNSLVNGGDKLKMVKKLIDEDIEGDPILNQGVIVAFAVIVILLFLISRS